MHLLYNGRTVQLFVSECILSVTYQTVFSLGKKYYIAHDTISVSYINVSVCLTWYRDLHSIYVVDTKNTVYSIIYEKKGLF